MCGEKMMKAGSNCAMLGSPPRMRGKAVQSRPDNSNHRITPAYAGKSLVVSGRSSRALGSPPRMRGKGVVYVFVSEKFGITPAYAGKRKSCVVQKINAWDHPRVCGEKLSPQWILSCRRGSPPRMRGKVLCSSLFHGCSRITPAYAGKRGGVPMQKYGGLDHPRVCGEKCLSWFIVADVAGSPPRMRGKEISKVAAQPLKRITPAYAGKR